MDIDEQLEGYFVLKKAALDKSETLALTPLTAGNYHIAIVMSGLKKIQQEHGKSIPVLVASESADGHAPFGDPVPSSLPKGLGQSATGSGNTSLESIAQVL